ncbi:MAG: OmpA family protein [Pseudomonadota bacterium]
MKRVLALSAAAAFGLAACTTTDPYTGEQKASGKAKGAGVGALIGAAAGALTNTSSGKQAGKNAAIGAAAGALIGGSVGAYMDRQEAQLREQLQGTGVSVTRVGDNIVLNMPGNVTFNTDSSDLNSSFYGTLNSVALVLNEYDQTAVEVSGHTDSRGSDQYNQQLSQRRAQSVASYLQTQKIDAQRFRVFGLGESRPIADNTTDAGMAQNRRVEIQIAPNT